MRLLAWDYNSDIKKKLAFFGKGDDEHYPDVRKTKLDNLEDKIEHQKGSSHGLHFDYLLIDGSALDGELGLPKQGEKIVSKYRARFNEFIKSLNTGINNINIIFYYSERTGEDPTHVFYEGESRKNYPNQPHFNLDKHYRVFHVSRDRLNDMFTRDAIHFERALIKAEQDYLNSNPVEKQEVSLPKK